ncbi:MAG: YeeE/YedE thiosulfate transporter family protein [Pseudomonadota bacterium]
MTFLSAILGGVLIGLAAVWMYGSLGRIAGISGIAGRAWRGLMGRETRVTWPWMFILGLGLGGWLAYAILGTRPTVGLADLGQLQLEQFLALGLAGVLVGIGTRMGSGCTSGHGVCGLSRFSVRSLAATVTFLLVGMLTATGLGWL